MMNRLPEKLTALRKHCGYSQGDLSEKLQVSVQEYMNWENGNSVPRITQLKEMADLFRVPLQDLADHTRTVILPHLETEEDSVQIPFMGKEELQQPEQLFDDIPQENDEPVSSATRTINTAADTIDAEVPVSDRGETRVLDTSMFEETQVSRIIDENDYEDDEEEKPVRRVRLKPQVLTAAVILALFLIALLGWLISSLGKSSHAQVSLSDTNRLALGSTYSMYLADEGVLLTKGSSIPTISGDNLVQISASGSHVLGLKNDGTVVCAGAGNACDINDWEDIVMIASGTQHSVGLKKNGTVICKGSSAACAVSGWKDIRSVHAGNEITVGIKNDGTLVYAGSVSAGDRLSEVTDAKDVSVSSTQIAVTTGDGKVTCYAVSASGTSNTATWSGMETAKAGGSFAAGLSGGRVSAASNDDSFVKEVSRWMGVRYIASSANTLIAVDENGYIFGAGDNTYNVYDAYTGEVAEETAAPAEDAVRLDQVRNITFSVTAANLSLHWDPVANADYYEVSVNTDPITTLKSNKNSASVSSDRLTSGTTYKIAITACSNSEDYTESIPTIVKYTYEANLLELAAPHAVAQQEKGTTNVTISWNNVNNAGYYLVELQDYSVKATGTSMTLDASGLSDGEYTVYVTAYPAEGQTKYRQSQPSAARFSYTKPVKKFTVTFNFSNGTKSSVSLENGTYKVSDYAANMIPSGMMLADSGQQFTVNGSDITVDVGLKEAEYSVTINFVLGAETVGSASYTMKPGSYAVMDYLGGLDQTLYEVVDTAQRFDVSGDTVVGVAVKNKPVPTPTPIPEDTPMPEPAETEETTEG